MKFSGRAIAGAFQKCKFIGCKLTSSIERLLGSTPFHSNYPELRVFTSIEMYPSMGCISLS
ncbi:hypothetical protein CKA32_003725 [Geitlerinema sp. FC II]|nr:hypothetical protein CKA32_003725 [Geitlerinema sp. FC II]